MKRRNLSTAALIMAMLLITSGIASANGDRTYLHEPHQGTVADCSGLVTWHFVNNKTERAEDPGRVRIEFAPDETPGSGWDTTVTAEKVLRNVQHFYKTTYQTELVNAFSNLPGKLVLSDWSCEYDLTN